VGRGCRRLVLEDNGVTYCQEHTCVNHRFIDCDNVIMANEMGTSLNILSCSLPLRTSAGEAHLHQGLRRSLNLVSQVLMLRQVNVFII